MRTFREFLEANARLVGARQHPLYGRATVSPKQPAGQSLRGQQPLQQQAITPQMQQTAQQISNQPVGNQVGNQGKPITATNPQVPKLNRYQSHNQVAKQLLDAFESRLATATPQQIQQMIDYNAKQMGYWYGQDVGEDFREKANYVLQRHQGVQRLNQRRALQS